MVKLRFHGHLLASSLFRIAFTVDRPGGERFELGPGDAAAFVLSASAATGALDRFEFFVKSRSHSKAESDSISSVQRQRQLPSATPGTFIRASLPKFSKSCSGEMARAATEDQANSIKAAAASLLFICGRFENFSRFFRSSSGKSSNQARAVGLS